MTRTHDDDDYAFSNIQLVEDDIEKDILNDPSIRLVITFNINKKTVLYFIKKLKNKINILPLSTLLD
jgi:hypothetical protein